MAELQSVAYRACMYVRLSKEDELSLKGEKAESNSISNQKSLIRDFVESSPDIQIVSIREDDGYTGTDYDRPGFQRMLDDIRAGLVNCVIVKDLSRFGREYINAGKYIDRLFPVFGVRLIAINDHIDTITRDPSDNFDILLKNLMNDNYCRDISVKIRSNLQVKRKNGEYIGAFAPYGYVKDPSDKNRLIVDPYAANVVQDIFRWKLDGYSQDAIARKLTAQGVPSPLEYKKNNGEKLRTTFKRNQQAAWTPVAVRRVLTNRVYTGTLVQGVRMRPNYKIKEIVVNDPENWVVMEGCHEAIIDDHQFALVQRLLALDTRTSPKEQKVFPLSGLLVCGDCHGPMVRKTKTSGGKKYYYYVCANHKQSGCCKPHQIAEDTVLSVALVTLQKHIEALLEVEECLSIIRTSPLRKISLRNLEDRIAAKEQENERYRRLKLSAYEDMKDGILSVRDYTDIRDQYDDRIASGESAILQMRNELDVYLFQQNTPGSPWIQDFLKYRRLGELNRNAAVECIEEIAVIDSKCVEVSFTHHQEFSAIQEQLEGFDYSERGAV